MASSVIGALRVNLGLDSAQFSQGLKQAETSSNKFAKAMKVGFAAAAAAATAAIAGLAVAVRSNLKSIDDLAKTSSKIGIPIEELSKLRYAADLSGVSMQGLQTGVQRLSRNMADAAKGTGAGAKAFQQLGIQVSGADGRLKSSSQIMAEIADRFQKMPDGAQKTALAMELMGRSGADMIPLLNGGSEALNGLLNEAKAFGLEISAETGKAAEQFNDNISRLGYAFQGVTLSLTAALAPAMVAVSNVLVGLAQGFVNLLAYLPQVGEYIAFVGGTMAIAFSPLILAQVVNLTAAIGVGLVGAFRALAVAMAANPLGALVAGIALALTAVYHFRDEIKAAIGVDVVAVVKNVANFIIGAFVAAFEEVKMAVMAVPDVFVAAGEAAANGFLQSIQWMVRETISLINGMIASINGVARGAGLGNVLGDLGAPASFKVPKVDIGGAAASERLAGYSANRRQVLTDALTKDYIGGIAGAFSSGTSEVQKFTGAVDDANAALDEMGGGGGGGGKGKGGGSGGKSKLDAIKDNVKSAATEMERMVDTIAGAMGSAFQGLIDGSKSVKDVIKDLLSQFASMLANSAFKSLVSGVLGGGGGGFFSGIGKLFGFARGGTILPGGSGGIDSQLVAFRKSPNERVDITKPGQSLTNGEQNVHVTVSVDDDGKVQAYVSNMGRQAAQAGAAVAVNQVKNGFPSMLANAQSRSL